MSKNRKKKYVNRVAIYKMKRFVTAKNKITKILNSEENSKRNVPNQMTKIKSSNTSNERVITVLEKMVD